MSFMVVSQLCPQVYKPLRVAGIVKGGMTLVLQCRDDNKHHEEFECLLHMTKIQQQTFSIETSTYCMHTCIF